MCICKPLSSLYLAQNDGGLCILHTPMILAHGENLVSDTSGLTQPSSQAVRGSNPCRKA